jgi:putative peptidoglycan lipid II flippase
MTAVLYRQLGIAVCALGLTLGGLLQLVIVAAPLLRDRGMPALVRATDPRVRSVALMVVPLVVGSLVYKSDVLVGRVIASLLPAGDVSYLSYAQRIAGMVITVSSAGLTTVIFPRMAKRAAQNDSRGMAEDATTTMKFVGLLTMMVLVPLCAASVPLVAVALERGAFTRTATISTAAAVVAYAAYVYGSALAGVCSNGLYSLRRVRAVVVVGLVGFAANIAMAFLLVPYFGYLGVAIAASVAALLNLGLFIWRLAAAGVLLDLRSLVRFHVTAAPAAAVAWLVGTSLIRGLGPSPVMGVPAALLSAVVLLGVAAVLGNREARSILSMLRTQGAR